MARHLARQSVFTALATITFLSASWLAAPSSKADPNRSDSTPSKGESSSPAASESVLGEFVVTGTVQEHIPTIAILPSFSSLDEDVIVRSVVRKDLGLSGMFKIIEDSKAPNASYSFSDPVDVKAWQRLGAEAVIKVRAREQQNGRIQVIGLAYFPSTGKAPVYETKLVVDKENARKTAHQIVDDLLGALTGRPGGFSSRFSFSAPWVRKQVIFVVDSDGSRLAAQTDKKQVAIGPTFGPAGKLFYSQSVNYSPFQLHSQEVGATSNTAFKLPFSGSIYSSTFDKEKKRLAVAVAEKSKSSIYVGAADGSAMKRISQTDLATHPTFSPDGRLAWVGGPPGHSAQRVYVDGKPVSPSGFNASAPTFCDTEDGIFLVYAVSVGGGRQDLIMSRPNGKGLVRLTQNQGSNSYPACSPDGRLLAFFSTRKAGKGLYMLSLKRWTSTKILGTIGESLRWEPLPREELTKTAAERRKELEALENAKRGPACGLAPSPEN